MNELAFAARRLWKDRWSAAAAALVFALGTGLSTALFAVTYGVLLRPLPFADPGRLAVTDASASLAAFPQWRAELPAFDRVSGYAANEGVTIRGLSEPRFVPAAAVDDAFFDTLGARPLAGRTFQNGDAAGTAVISEALARETSGSAAAVIGRAITVGNRAFTIVGVMPKAFGFPDDGVKVWVPARSLAPIAFDRSPDERRLRLFGRLRPAATLAEARSEVERARADLDPRARRAADVPGGVERVYDRLVGPIRPMLFAFSAGALIVLVIACANVATILIGRTIARRRELAIRGAIGASRGQLFLTTLSESCLVSVAGGALGAVLAWAAVRAISMWASGIVPRLADVRVDWPVLAFAAVAVAFSALLAAAPAMRAIQPAADMLRASAGNTRRGVGTRSSLAVLQVALSVVLLTSGTLLARSIVKLLGEDTGIDARHTLVSQLVLADAMNFKAAAKQQWLETMLDRLRRIPGIVSAGAGSSMPPDHATLVMTVSMRDDTGSRTSPDLTFAAVTPGYLEAVGARLLRGRFFDTADERRGDLVAMLSASAARVLGASTTAPGQPLPLFLPGMRERGHATIVGIVADAKYAGLSGGVGPAVYVLWHELPASRLYLAVRTAGDPLAAAPAVRRMIHEFDPSTPLMPILPMADAMERSVAAPRLRALLGIGFAGLAFAIALVALAGGLGRLVVERRRELAIRAALGATPRRTIGDVMKEGALIVAGGVVCGMIAAYGAAAMLRSFVWGISAHDPLTFGLVAVCVTAASLIVCYVPARAASKTDPIELLRAD